MNLIYSTIDDHRKTIHSILGEIEKLEKKLKHNLKSQNRLTELDRIAELNPLERLNAIIDSSHAIYYYPDFMLEDSFEYIEQLSPESKEKLLNKLKTAKRGTLKRLKLSLSLK